MVTDIFNSGRFFFSTTTVINEVKLSLSSSVGTISKAIQAMELILTLQQAFNVLSVTMQVLACPFLFSWKCTQPAMFNCGAFQLIFMKVTAKDQ